MKKWVFSLRQIFGLVELAIVWFQSSGMYTIFISMKKLPLGQLFVITARMYSLVLWLCQ